MASFDPTPFDPPMPYGRYELLEPIGLGGMAEVFRARLPGIAGFEKPVVIKRLQTKFQNDARFRRMFVEEAKLASQVQHKNVVQVFELGHHEGQLFMVLEYVSGTDLKRLLRKASDAGIRLPVWLSVHIIVEVLEALAYAHDLRDTAGRRRNLVHCDVSPENIFVSASGEVKLADFGIAHDDTRAEDEFPGQIRGKLAYMSPEQLSGQNIDQRSDVFSTAVVLWEALTQRRLFRDKNDDVTVARICHAERPRPSEVNADVPPSLDDLLLSALRADRADRTRTAREFQRGLTAVQVELRHQVAQLDVERALRKIWSPHIAITGDLDPSESVETPTVERPVEDRPISSGPQMAWNTLPPRPEPFPRLPEPEIRQDVPLWAAVTLPPTGIAAPPSSELNGRRSVPPPASLAAGWTAALTGAAPPRLPPGHTAWNDPLALPPTDARPSQVETADILRSPPPRRGSATPPPMKVVVGEPSAESLGMWLRRPGGPETGPRPILDTLTVLRRLLLDGPILEVQVSVDGLRWRDGLLLARLLGEEVVRPDPELPPAEDYGTLRQTSLIALFGRLFRERRSGRLTIIVDGPGRPERYELHVDRGRLFHVASSRSLLAAWRCLLGSPQVEQPQLRVWMSQVIELAQPFELVAAPSAVEAVRAQQANFAQDDLQMVFAEQSARWAFSDQPSPPFPNGSGHALLTLVPSLVSRACRTPELERRLSGHLQTPIERTEDYEVEVGHLGLSYRDASALERFADGVPLDQALASPSSPRLRKLTLVLAYSLLELGLIRPCYAVSP